MAKSTRNPRKKPPKCVKGWSCGMSCIARGRRCRNPLEGQSKTLADYIVRWSAPPAPIVYPLTHEGDIARGKALLGDEDAAFIESLKGRDPIVLESFKDRQARILALVKETPEIIARSAEGDALFDEYIRARDVQDSIATETEASKRDYESAARLYFAFNNETVNLKEKLGNQIREDLKQTPLVAERIATLARIESIRTKILESSPLSEAQATALVDRQVSFPRRWEQSDPELRTNYIEHARMTGGVGLQNPVRVKLSFNRAEANPIGILETTPNDKPALWHEATHFIEFNNPQIAEANSAWKQSRATGSVTPIRYLERAGSRRGLDEVAVPDEFISPYVGRTYYSRAGEELKLTEVGSMAIERFSSPQLMRELASADSEHFFLALGQIRR